MKITCMECETEMYVPESRMHLKYCSVECWQESRRLDEAEVALLAKIFKTRVRVAEELEMPYRTFYGKLLKQNLNHRWKEWSMKDNREDFIEKQLQSGPVKTFTKEEIAEFEKTLNK